MRICGYNVGLINAVDVTPGTPYVVSGASKTESCLFKAHFDNNNGGIFNYKVSAPGPEIINSLFLGSRSTIPTAPLHYAVLHAGGRLAIVDAVREYPGSFRYFEVDSDHYLTNCPNNDCGFTVEVNPSAVYYIETMDNRSRCDHYGNIWLELYDSTGTVRWKELNAGALPYSDLQVGLEYGKTYMLKASSYAYRWWNSTYEYFPYSIRWGSSLLNETSRKRPGCPDEYEPYDNTPTGSITLPMDTVQDHSIHVGTDSDWYIIRTNP